MGTFQTLTEKHSFISEAIFHLKSSLLIGKRSLQNSFRSTKRFVDSGQLKNATVISFSYSELWNQDDNEQNWILTAGKIQNLRIALQYINGIEIPAGQTFSFWKQLGKPHSLKKYVLGRELREGCIIPSIGGGLCQLSNALYDAALKAGFEIAERHRHTKIIKGSLAEQDRDATVKWNYIDLRFRAPVSFRIEAELTEEKLIVRFKSLEQGEAVVKRIPVLNQPSILNDCYSCGNEDCFKYPGERSRKKQAAVTTFILDERWKEQEAYIKTIAGPQDFFIVPLKKNGILKSKRSWTGINPGRTKAVSFAALKRILKTRILSRDKKNPFELSLLLDKNIAKSMAAKIPIESTHLVVSQNLLPFLWSSGAMGGRSFDVLMSRLPMEKLHSQLDEAHQRHPQSKTLNDFRAPASLVELESAALTKARRIITAHRQIAGIFNNKSIKLDWLLPEMNKRKKAVANKILFPASSLARKGAYEVKRLAQELNLCVVITGKATEADDFWEDVKVEFAGTDPFENTCMVVYPAYIEHQPGILLKAIATGLPVVATTACGLDPADNLVIVAAGDYDALKEAVMLQL